MGKICANKGCKSQSYLNCGVSFFQNDRMMSGSGPDHLTPTGSPSRTPPLNLGTLTPPRNEDSAESTNTAPVWNNDNTQSSSSANRESSDEEPPSKMRKMTQNDDMDGETCPICLDSWSNSGEHRLVALKCGHLFGAQCVKRWLKAREPGQRACPTCKTKANVKDLRNIYARRLVAADNSQIVTLQQQIETLHADKSRTELELQKSKIALRACSIQLEGLRSLMRSQATQEQPQRKTWRFALEKNLEVCKDGSCRVLTYNCRTYELYVSQKSVNSLFPGYGIRKVNLNNSLSEYCLGQYVPLHPKPIRDITYSQPRDLLLSVALDSTAKIVERCNSSNSINAGFPLWSCSWDYLRSNEFYVGGVGGVIHQYDIRNSSFAMQTLSTPGDISPVISICSTEFGLLSCQLNSVSLWSSSNGQWEPRALPIKGSFMSLRYDNDTQRAVVLSRPGSNGLDRSRLTLCKLKMSIPDGEVMVDIEETFPGSARSSLMCRTAWVKVPDTAWVAAHSESDTALYLHGLNGSRSLSLPAITPTIDVASIEVNGTTILAALSDSRLKLYKAVTAQL